MKARIRDADVIGLRNFLCFITLIYIPCNSFCQSKIEEVPHYALFFADGFTRDSLSLTINERLNINNLELNTIGSLGMVNTTIKIVKKKKRLYAFRSSNFVGKLKDTTPENITLNVQFRHRIYLFEVSQSDGKYLLFSCDSNGTLIKKQLVKEPVFM